MNHLIPQYAYVAFCLFFAYLNYRLINILNERVRHGINGIFHATTALYFGIFVHWALGLALLIEARLFFDVALNLFRFGAYGIFYVPARPKSIVDKAEKAVFGNNAILPKFIYAIAIVTLNILLFKNIV